MKCSPEGAGETLTETISSPYNVDAVSDGMHPMTNPHYLALWEFQVKPESISVFERTYGPAGAWAQLFRQSPDYLGTELIRDLDHPGRYLTLDKWISRESLNRFKKDHQVAYAALDKQCEPLTEKETFQGDFKDVQL